jgi:Transposase DDE domain
MASIACTLERIKQDLEPFLPQASITRACDEAGHTWREREYGPVRTVQLFILQVLCFNTAMTHLRLLAKAAVKAPAYCRARMRLPLQVLQTLLRDSAAAMRKAGSTERWCGLRPLLVDGSSTIAPDTPESQKAFGQPSGQKPGCGFPVPKVLGLLDAATGLIVELLAFPLRTHEQSKVWKLHPLLGPLDLLVGDRGFCSFAHLAMLAARGVMGLFRMHQRQIVDFRPHRKARSQAKRQGRSKVKRPMRGKGKGKKGSQGRGQPTSRFIKRLAKHDQIVEWLKPVRRPAWMTAEQYAGLPPTLLVRELRYWLARQGQRTLCVTIATTLLDPVKYPKQNIAELYQVRWTVETHFAELKTTLKMRRVKSQTPEGVKKELAVYALVYNLVHVVMLQAAQRQGVDVGRVSFLDAVRWLLSAEPGEPMPDLIVNPHRPDRHEPRVIKDLQDTYRKMTKPRAVLRKALKKQAAAA